VIRQKVWKGWVTVRVQSCLGCSRTFENGVEHPDSARVNRDVRDMSRAKTRPDAEQPDLFES